MRKRQWCAAAILSVAVAAGCSDGSPDTEASSSSETGGVADAGQRKSLGALEATVPGSETEEASTVAVPREQRGHAAEPGTATAEPRTATAEPATTATSVTAMEMDCGEQYGPDTLRARDHAFDGEIIAATPAVDYSSLDRDRWAGRITLSVRRWYRGSGGSEVTLYAHVVGNPAGPFPTSPGTRLLVSGDDDWAFPCNFTQPWTAALAEEWSRILEG